MSAATGLTKDEVRAILEAVEERRGTATGGGNWATINGHRVFFAKDGGGGGGLQRTPRLDMNGVPFSKPTYYLPNSEYKHVYSEISTYYDSKYKGKPFAKYKTNKTIYCFENRGYGDYNIYDKYEEK